VVMFLIVVLVIVIATIALVTEIGTSFIVAIPLALMLWLYLILSKYDEEESGE